MTDMQCEEVLLLLLGRKATASNKICLALLCKLLNAFEDLMSQGIQK